MVVKVVMSFSFSSYNLMTPSSEVVTKGEVRETITKDRKLGVVANFRGRSQFWSGGKKQG